MSRRRQRHQHKKSTANSTQPTNQNQTGTLNEFLSSDRAALKDRPPAAETEPNQINRSEKGKRCYDNLVVIASFIAAIGSMFAAFFTGYQAYIARDTEVVSNRAFVISNTVRFVSYDDPSQKGREWTMYSIAENTGNTPTKNLQYTTKVGVCNTRMPNSEDIEEFVRTPVKEINRAIIGPKSEINAFSVSFSNVQINCPVAISIIGLIKYHDIFDNVHITMFCSGIDDLHEINKFPANTPIKIPTTPCAHHNCADDECGADWMKFTNSF